MGIHYESPSYNEYILIKIYNNKKAVFPKKKKQRAEN
jgi:hypothetical protein